MNQDEIDFLKESNLIESEPSDEAFNDACAAWEYAKQYKHELSLDVILKIHHTLMRRLNSKIAGKWRVNVAVTVGGKYISGESKYFIRKKVSDWLEVCKVPTGLGAEEDIKRWHIAFENIHPFIDGNGRVGRILLNLQRVAVGLPILVIHTGREQQEYYQWFREKFEINPCKRCMAPTKSQFCDACYASTCKACGRRSYGQEYCAWCWKGTRKR